MQRGREAEAQADVAARVQEQLVRDRAAAIQAAVQSAMGLRGQEIDLDQNLWARTDADRNFGLNAELGRGNLDIANRRLAFDQATNERDFAYRQGRDKIGDAQWDKKFNYEVGRDERDFNFRKETDARDFDWRKSTDERDFGYL